MKQKITVKGRIPSKKNSTWTMVIKGRPIRLPSKKYQEWHTDKKGYVESLGIETITNIQQVTIEFHLPDLRKTDLTNKAESIMDLLVDCKVIVDDNCQEIPKLILVYKGKDKENPRAEICVEYQPS